VSRPYEASPPPPSLPAGCAFGIKDSLPDGIGGVADFSGPSGCVNMNQYFAASNVRVISACSDRSSPFQFTMTGLSSSARHVIFAPLCALQKKGGVVRPVSPM